MIGRRQLPVASPISPTALLRALRSATADAESLAKSAEDLVCRQFDARAAVLTDSGTSALVLALRLAVRAGGVVAFPGYACVDLTAAARYAGVRVRLYDLDPSTLSPDLASLRRTFDERVDAVVVAHLFGYPADVSGVRALATERGITVIEDAAQGAGGLLDGSRLGSLGDLSISSFGRGKGLCAGGGGALLASNDRWAAAITESCLPAGGRGLAGLAKVGVQWALGRPSVYAIPSMIPWLRLGQMVYHPASEPTSMALAANALLPSAFALEPADLEMRRKHARAFDAVISHVEELLVVHPIIGATPGYLRYAVRDPTRRAADAKLGIARPYPVTMSEQSELAPMLEPKQSPTPGATELRETLVTLPTHRFVDRRDFEALWRWMTAGKIAPFPEVGLSFARGR